MNLERFCCVPAGMRKPLQLLLLTAALLPLGVRAQMPQLLILGTAHLNNPGHDMNNMAVDDVLTAKRQVEIADVVNHMARFRPTRVAIECDPQQQAKWDSRYAEFRAGKYSLTRDERDQIGLRLANAMNLPQVDCVDFQGSPPGPEEAYDFPAYALAHGQQAALDALKVAGKAMVADETAFLRTHALIDWYRRMNTAASLKADNALYFRYAAMGGNDAHPGAAWVGGWYARNLIIMENVRRIARPGDRVFMIFGAGHGYLLHAFAEDSGAFHVVDTESFLR